MRKTHLHNTFTFNTQVPAFKMDSALKKWQPTPVFLPAELHGQRRLVGYGPEGLKESDTTENTSMP